MRKLIIANWKMNGLRAHLTELCGIADAAAAHPLVDVIVCPPATLIAAAVTSAPRLMIGAQDCHAAVTGAFTGDLAAAMLAEAGARAVIVGHSERRAGHGETDADVRGKAEAALAAGLFTIICVGEDAQAHDTGAAFSTIEAQLAGSVPRAPRIDQIAIAYEPRWAIGSGRTPTTTDLGRIHAEIRAALTIILGPDAAQVPIIYGGSITAANADDILRVPNVDGLLVGGASLSAADFGPIIAAAAGLSAAD